MGAGNSQSKGNVRAPLPTDAALIEAENKVRYSRGQPPLDECPGCGAPIGFDDAGMLPRSCSYCLRPLSLGSLFKRTGLLA